MLGDAILFTTFYGEESEIRGKLITFFTTYIVSGRGEIQMQVQSYFIISKAHILFNIHWSQRVKLTPVVYFIIEI